MGSKGDHNRQRIVEAADQLFYQRGYNQTSFSDIAQAAELSRGNFYYYFKSKDEILSAVIARRRDQLRARLEAWTQASPDPHERLRRFVGMMQDNRGELLRYGCPVGSLTQELSKTQRRLQAEAVALFEVLREWIETQMGLLGVSDPAGMAMHLLAVSQGVTLLGSVYADPDFLEREVARLEAWVDRL
ncbi:TetR/AcrR family transcriptional regulator [Acidihalobacter prosperus]|uniref:HTH tetR-type domain-containing protein n=1 Tax=Acidihalobacter prosperus TaxID=160660 RepID=A0A1A6C5S0_9GAMM|nr:TetR/AcrR family transcriptional regulator [Acidihalobacter prosperus]OBS09894.1 hypothetical protein Thpro_020944 [Acidihalobacter prosperus]